MGVTCVRRKVRCDTPQTAVAVAWVEPLSIVDAIGARVPCPVEHRRSRCVPCLLQKPAPQGEPDPFVLYALQALYGGRNFKKPICVCVFFFFFFFYKSRVHPRVSTLIQPSFHKSKIKQNTKHFQNKQKHFHWSYHSFPSLFV